MSRARHIVKIAAGAAGAALIVLLFAQARSLDPIEHSRVIANLSKIEELNSELDEAVLKLRDALLNNYDPLVATLSRMRWHKRDLEQGEYAIARRGDGRIDAAMARFSRELEDKEALIERFKSRNALLKNSFHYLPLSVETLSRDPRTPQAVRMRTEALLRDILLLRLGATASDYELLGSALAQLREQQERQPAPVRGGLERVLGHAQNVLAHQEEMDGLVRDITADHFHRMSKSLAEAYGSGFERKLNQANLSRLVLLLLSLGLAAYAAYFFLRLRKNAVELNLAVAAQANEIAERKRAEQALRESEERYRRLFESNPQPMYVHDNEALRFLAVNDAAIAHYGYSREEFLTMTLADIRPPEDVPELIESLAAVHGQSATRSLRRHKKKDGTLIEVEISSHELTFFDRPARLALATDVTEKRRAEEQLRLAASALENAAEGMTIMDERRRILFVNQSFTRITGYAPQEVIGRNPDLLRSGEHDAAFYEEVWGEIGKSGSWQGEVWRRRKSGEIYPEWRSISAVKDPSGAASHYVAVFTDISQLKRDKARLEFLANHDALTRLPNRTLFQDRLQEAVNRARRHAGKVGLLFIDLDRFKDVNDSLGHGAGDRLLQAVGERLKEGVRESDTVARMGGDEFMVLLDELADSRDAAKVAEKILAHLAQPYPLGGQELFMSGSIGISCYPDDGDEPQTLQKNADAAMYRAKQMGRNGYQFFSAEMNAHALESLLMTNKLRLGLERDEFQLHYQPIVDLASGRVSALEALLRWQQPELGVVPPIRFIPLAEDSGLIIPLGDLVLKRACRQMKAWQAEGIAPQRMAVNLSVRQFKQKDLVGRIAAILDRSGLAPQCLELEITESMVMQDPAEAKNVLERLHKMGICLAIDDFGTGYSSLNYLKRFPVDFLKIDRSFVRDIPADRGNTAITRAVIALAKSLDLRVIAEGVETDVQRAFLEAERCDEAQGYLFSRPASAADIGVWLQSSSRPPEAARRR